jgi:hypothetical protein
MKFAANSLMCQLVAGFLTLVGSACADETADPAIAAAVESPAAEFEATLLDGSSVAGKLTALADDTATLVTQAGDQQVVLKEVLSLVQSSDDKTAAGPAAGEIHVELADGTLLFAESISATKQTASLKIPKGPSLEVDMRMVRWVRWRDVAGGNGKLDAAWREFVQSDPAGDLLVIRKNGALDSIEGVVGGVTNEAIQFSLDGDTISVKLPRVEGIVFARGTVQEIAAARSVATLTEGSRLSLAGWKMLPSGEAELTTPSGIVWKTPLSSIAKLDFSAGKLVYLSDLEPEKSDYRAFFAPAVDLPALRDAYLPRGDRALDGGALVLDGRTYRKGLAMYSKGLLVYRLPEKLSTFSATVGIVDRARSAGGDVELTIKGDGKTLWQGSVRAGEAPVPLQLSITGVKRLELVADYGSGQDVGDHLLLCDAKVTK